MTKVSHLPQSVYDALLGGYDKSVATLSGVAQKVGRNTYAIAQFVTTLLRFRLRPDSLH